VLPFRTSSVAWFQIPPPLLSAVLEITVLPSTVVVPA